MALNRQQEQKAAVELEEVAVEEDAAVDEDEAAVEQDEAAVEETEALMEKKTVVKVEIGVEERRTGQDAGQDHQPFHLRTGQDVGQVERLMMELESAHHSEV